MGSLLLIHLSLSDGSTLTMDLIPSLLYKVSLPPLIMVIMMTTTMKIAREKTDKTIYWSKSPRVFVYVFVGIKLGNPPLATKNTRWLRRIQDI